ncbi:HAMP domain-containing sensor histidine kinase (plasmid) [Paraburkholderia sp. PREW-6R]|uniref:sensor histidine kinase n=1 Tax=Paraburkholderia sp. PREW-6R TaxID=3141544 RepID=UPI0031F488ED
MKRIPFATQLVLLWALVAVICVLLAGIIWLLFQTDQSRQIAIASQQATVACEHVAARYSLSRQFAGDAYDTDLMHAVLDTVLIQAPKVEGGFWEDSESGTAGSSPPARPMAGPQAHVEPAAPPRPSRGFLAYSFPTYEGSGVKRDIPEAETPLILRALRQAASGHGPVNDSVPGGQGATVGAACPVAGSRGLYAWTLTRAQAPLGPYGHVLVLSLAVVLTGILVIALLLGIALRRWRNSLSALERSLSPDTAASFVSLAAVGEPDLDKIIVAVNGFAARSSASQARAAALSEKLLQAERFSSLGKLAAQVAHEIRNPLGAVRLKLENILAHDGDAHHSALVSALGQVERIETQVSSLLALTQPVALAPRPMNAAEWVASTVNTHDEQARMKSVTLSLDVACLNEAPRAGEEDAPQFDPVQMARALDNLILNAIRHAPVGGRVTVSARQVARDDSRMLRIAVVDNGPGVPAADRERIFEPFVTGRPDGSGLGLAVAREVATAHGGSAYLAETENGACFVIEVPWHTYS